MSYRIVWRERIWNNIYTITFITLQRGGDPAAISRAVIEIERRLTDAPADEGESRADNERVLIVHPVSVTFEVFEAQQIVLIYEAIVYPRQRA